MIVIPIANSSPKHRGLCILATLLIILTHSEIFILCDSDNHEVDDKLYEPDQDIHEQNPNFVESGLIYFQISEPENLRYTFKAKTSRIGVPFSETHENIALVLAEPRSACASIINKLEIRDNIALVERGVCPFLEKCIEIERSGGIGLIVYDYDKNNSEEHIEMIDDSTPRNCSIPAVYVLGKDGHMIVQSLLALRLSRAIVTIPVNVAANKTNPPWAIM